MFDGYDITSIGMAVPSLSAAWHIPGAAFANTFVMSSVGIMVGALLSGPAGDRLGRKPVLIASLAFLADLLAGLRLTPPASRNLIMWRFVTGIGIGGIMPATVALTSDYVPERLRAPIVMVIFTGNPLGGFLGGQLIAQLLPHFGWPVIFWIGGLLPLALIPVMLFWLPESPRFLLARGRMTTRTERLLQTLNIETTGTTGQPAAHVVDVATGNPVAGLFRDGLATTTVLVWILYFANLLSIYLISYWLPTVLNLSGLSPADSVFAASLMSAGPLVSVFAMAPLARHFGPQRVLAVMLITGVVVIATVGLANPPHDLAAAGDLPDGLLHGRQYDRDQRHDRRALSGPHPYHRHGLGSGDRPVGRHRRTVAWRRAAGRRLAAAANLPVRLHHRVDRHVLRRDAAYRETARRASAGPAPGVTSRPGPNSRVTKGHFGYERAV